MSITPALSRLRCAGWTGALACCALLCCLLGSRPANAAIAVDNVAQGATPGGNVASVSWTHTVGSGTNRILIVGVSLRTGNVAIGSVTFAGTPLLQLALCNRSDSQNSTSMWYLLAPTPTVNGTILVTIAGGQTGAIAAGSISFTGVTQSAPTGTFCTEGNTSTAVSVAVPSAAGQVVLDTISANGDAKTLVAGGAPQSGEWSIVSGTAAGGESASGGSIQTATGTTTTMNWTLGAKKPWSYLAVPLTAAVVLPAFVNLKTVQVSSDPINGSTNPKFIPGAKALYTVTITNQGTGNADNNSVVILDPVPANTKLFVNDLGGVGSGPVTFANGSPSSGLTYTFTSLASTTDDLSFSNDGGTTYNYTPTAGADGCDANVTNVRINPKGVFAAAGSGNPSFTLTYRVCVK
jgi:uncharacterized repeat protein (TIGR01451 family)